ncbi:hypothetical protein ACQ4M4_03475 [Leptolyngbya sp. AN02str]|uniref:hypothetical protein n=1 Tax=Leptolyngbya sp. AN02str TaxID=3423363 RepID=UPI003D311164
MLYLAQVQKKDPDGSTSLRLLAHQKAEHLWATLSAEETVLAPEAEAFPEGMLVLIQISSAHKVKSIEDAKPWILTIVEEFLSSGMTPELLQKEVERAEQWRQSLTLKSQELDRRSLEIEARKDQIQQLEENLKREKK